MEMLKTINLVSQEVSTVLSNIDEQQAIQLSESLLSAKRVFAFGEGRSGLMAKAFAMRLMHGGFTVHVVGETTTPNIGADDLLVLVSGSGSSTMIDSLVSSAKKSGAKVALVTTDPNAVVAKESASVLIVPAATKHRKAEEPATIQPLGNQFDQSVHLVLDAIIIYTLAQSSEHHSYEEMKKTHTNLE